MGDERETITVAESSDGPPTDTTPGQSVDLPVVEVLTGRGFITGKSGGGKSILEGTPVHTEGGRKPIEQVEEGDRVLSLNKHTYEQEFRDVQATIEHTDDRLLRVTLEDGTELVGTEDHSFLTADGLEIVPIRGDQLEEGTWLPVARTLPSAESVVEVDLADYLDDANNIVVDGGVIHSGPRTEDRTLNLDFPTGKEIGLYLAEGSFDSHLTLQLSNVDDDVQEFLGERGYNVYERTCNKGFRPYAKFLESEFGRGADGKSIPNWVFDTPGAFRAGLLSGYVDGDGTVGDTVSVMSKSPELIDGVSELFRQFGVSTTVRSKFTQYGDEKREFRRLRVDAFCLDAAADVLELSVEGKADRLRTLADQSENGDGYNAKDLIPNFGSVLNRAAREAGWTERDSQRRVDGASVHSLTRKQKAGRSTYNRLMDELEIQGRARAFGQSDVQWKRVVSVEELDQERTVYDLDVELNDNFVANGVFVHNSNTASVVAENLLDAGFGILIVDIDGEYYGLKEEYEILHVGADDECDIQVTTEHAGKIASLALEQNVPIILDVSSFLDEDEAESLLTEVSRQLFAKEKKLKQPFLMLVEEVHEWIPEKGSVTEAGKMLIKIGKRGRKHGLGMVGISQRPADVKKDFITQCDWLVWHRLTWNNDTKVVSRILGSEYAEAVEDLDDGEAFMMTDWAEQVKRVQFHRKQTFDAGATPGLEDVDRPDLKSVSSDLVSELEEISEEKQRTEDRIQELRQELDEKNSRIAELEKELQDARDMSRMADQFVDALVDAVQGVNPGRTEQERMRERRRLATGEPSTDDTGDAPSAEQSAAGTGGEDGEPDPQPMPAFDEDAAADGEDDPAEASTSRNGAGDDADDGDVAAAVAEVGDGSEPTDGESAETVAVDAGSWPGEVPPGGEELVEQLRGAVESMPNKTRGMLRYYRKEGPAKPLDAHFAGGGDGDRTKAYAHNRTLRTHGYIEHVGRGHYDYRLADLIEEEYPRQLDGDERDALVEAVEDGFVK
ncbi:MAG: LAGLIDADG family homing endonuclease [Halorientalis sp.]